MVSLDIYEECVQWVATQIFRSAGTRGTYATDFQIWMLCFGKATDNIRIEMAEWAYWLANVSPQWAAYQTVVVRRLVTLNKYPGVRSMGIGEVLWSLLSNIILHTG